jgi:hypothetical protein
VLPTHFSTQSTPTWSTCFRATVCDQMPLHEVCATAALLPTVTANGLLTLSQHHQQHQHHKHTNRGGRRAEGEDPAGASPSASNGRTAASSSHADQDDMVHSAKMGGALKILERMANQNAEDEIFQDFKYWEDASDQFRDGEGSLLPLWRFSTVSSTQSYAVYCD